MKEYHFTPRQISEDFTLQQLMVLFASDEDIENRTNENKVAQANSDIMRKLREKVSSLQKNQIKENSNERNELAN